MYALGAGARLWYACNFGRESNTDRNSNTSCPSIGHPSLPSVMKYGNGLPDLMRCLRNTPYYVAVRPM